MWTDEHETSVIISKLSSGVDGLNFSQTHVGHNGSRALRNLVLSTSKMIIISVINAFIKCVLWILLLEVNFVWGKEHNEGNQ